MSQDRPIKIPSIKGFHFLPKYDGEIICLRKNVPVRKESFLAEMIVQFLKTIYRREMKFKSCMEETVYGRFLLLVNRKKIR